MSKAQNVSIPADYNLRKIIETMLSKLWLRDALSERDIQEILEIGRGR
jgi:hypothetical protein